MGYKSVSGFIDLPILVSEKNDFDDFVLMTTLRGWKFLTLVTFSRSKLLKTINLEENDFEVGQ